MIVFLDFDGVLHPDPCTDAARLFENAPRLAFALGDFPQVGVVLSTCWRHSKPYEQLLAVLPAALHQRIIGMTPNFCDFVSSTPLIPYPREAECMHWLHKNRLQDEGWIALDDRPSWFSPYCENLITCDPRSGFDEAASAHLCSALRLDFQRRGRTVDLLID